MNKFLLADTIVLEEFCNLACDYCDADSPFKFSRDELIAPDDWKKEKRDLLSTSRVTSADLWNTYT